MVLAAPGPLLTTEGSTQRMGIWFLGWVHSHMRSPSFPSVLRLTFSLLCVFGRMRTMAKLLRVRRYLHNVRSQSTSCKRGRCMRRCCEIRPQTACVIHTCFITPDQCPCLMRPLPCILFNVGLMSKWNFSPALSNATPWTFTATTQPPVQLTQVQPKRTTGWSLSLDPCFARLDTQFGHNTGSRPAGHVQANGAATWRSAAIYETKRAAGAWS